MRNTNSSQIKSKTQTHVIFTKRERESERENEKENEKERESSKASAKKQKSIENEQHKVAKTLTLQPKTTATAKKR